jgi:hypothetical protein
MNGAVLKSQLFEQTPHDFVRVRHFRACLLIGSITVEECKALVWNLLKGLSYMLNDEMREATLSLSCRQSHVGVTETMQKRNNLHEPSRVREPCNIGVSEP